MTTFKKDDFVVREHSDYGKVKLGATYIVTNVASDGLKLRTLTGLCLEARYTASRFRLATPAETQAAQLIGEPALGCFIRDGFSLPAARAIVQGMTQQRELPRATPSVRYAFRRNPPVRKPTQHAMPVGWKYGLRDPRVDEPGFDQIVFSRPTGWSPLG
jgi:hypothetical protein